MAIHQEDGFVDITAAITAHQSIRKGHAMNNVLCFGDSNTFGTNPAKPGTRHPFNIRWAGRLAKLLGPEWRVIEEGMGGRTLSIRQPFGAAPFRVGGASDHIAITLPFATQLSTTYRDSLVPSLVPGGNSVDVIEQWASMVPEYARSQWFTVA